MDYLEFAGFLERLAKQQTSSGTLEWDRYIVAHYADDFLEEMRRCVGRLMMNELPIHGDTDAGRNVLWCWAMAVRAAGEKTATAEVRLPVTREEAVVLDRLLMRYSMTDQLSIEHPSEQQALWNLQCVLERHGDRPDWPSLEVARRALEWEQ